MNHTRIAAAALAAAMALPLVAADEATEPDLVDLVGDANHVNTQGALAPLDEQAGPAGVPGADIQFVDFDAVITDGVLEQVLVEVGLDQSISAPSPEMTFRVTGNISGCDAWFGLEKAAAGGGVGFIRYLDGCGFPADTPTNPVNGAADLTEGVVAEATDSGFLLTVTIADLPEFAQALFKPASKYVVEDAHVRHNLQAATAPAIDELIADFYVWTIGD